MGNGTAAARRSRALIIAILYVVGVNVAANLVQQEAVFPFWVMIALSLPCGAVPVMLHLSWYLPSAYLAITILNAIILYALAAKRTKFIVAALRGWHAVAVLWLTFCSAMSLLDHLWDTPEQLRFFHHYPALYSGLTAINVYILWAACRRYGRPYVLNSLISFGLWLPLFMWFLKWGQPIPDDVPEIDASYLAHMWSSVAFFLGGYAVYPLLCYLDGRSRRGKEHGGLCPGDTAYPQLHQE